MSGVTGEIVRSIPPQVLLIAVCICGDVLITTPDRPRRALYDTLTHGTIGVLSWLTVTGVTTDKTKLLQAALCGLLASLIDLDHFIAARSWKLQNALSLRSRPFLHNTSLILVLCVTLWVVDKLLHTVWHITKLHTLPWICLIAWLSHHTRDAHRRGFWFEPLGSTPALPRWLYIGVILTLAWLVKLMIQDDPKHRLSGVIFLNGEESDQSIHRTIEL